MEENFGYFDNQKDLKGDIQTDTIHFDQRISSIIVSQGFRIDEIKWSECQQVVSSQRNAQFFDSYRSEAFAVRERITDRQCFQTQIAGIA